MARTLAALAVLAVAVAAADAQYAVGDWAEVPAEPKQTPVKVTSPGSCACDAQDGACTANCCCDTDCASSEKALFAYCLPEGAPPPQLGYCVGDSAVADVNLPASSGLAAVRKVEQKDDFFAGTLMCVLQDNNPLLGRFFQDPGAASSAALSAALVGDDAPSSFTRSPAIASSGSTYRVGSAVPVLRKLDNGLYVQGHHLTGPTAGPAGRTCDVLARVGFMQTEPSARASAHGDDLSNVVDGCSVATTQDLCASGSVLDLARYTSDVLVAKTPLASPVRLGEGTTAAITTPGADYTSVELTRVTRRGAFDAAFFDASASSTLTSAPSPVADANGTCRDALTQLEYVVYHDGGGTIESVHAYAAVSDVPLDAHVRVSFATRFYTSTEQMENARPQSGSPGYLAGKPVLAGTGVRGPSGTADASKTAVAQFPAGFPLMRALPTSGAQCAFDANLDAVAFGADTVATCSVPMTLAALRSFCTRASGGLGLQEYYRARLSGNAAAFPSGMMAGGANSEGLPVQVLASLYDGNTTYVGRWGNSKATNVADWVLVEAGSSKASRDMEWDESRLTCTNVFAGVEATFLTARVGDADAPQLRVGFAKLEATYSDWSWMGGAASEVRFPLRQTVRFVPQVQDDAAFVRPATPPLSSPLPGDFFYPFLTNAGSSARSPALLAAFASLLASAFVGASSCA